MKTETMMPALCGLLPEALLADPKRVAEKRNFVRFALAVPIRIRILDQHGADAAGLMKGHTMNISAGGVLLKTGSPIPAGARVRIEMMFSSLRYLGGTEGSSKSVIAVEGRVVRSGPRGVAVAFDSRISVTAGCGPEWRENRKI